MPRKHSGVLAAVFERTRLFTPSGGRARTAARGSRPGLAHQVHAAELELRPHGLELLDEAGDDPERGIVGAVGPPAPELVVEEHLQAVACELAEARQVAVVGAGPAVEPDERLRPEPKRR